MIFLLFFEHKRASTRIYILITDNIIQFRLSCLNKAQTFDVEKIQRIEQNFVSFIIHLKNNKIVKIKKSKFDFKTLSSIKADFEALNLLQN